MNTTAEGRPSRLRIAIVSTVVVVALAGVVLFSMLIWPVGCGGDGGSPYAALASPRGSYCELTTDSPVGTTVATLAFTFPVWGTVALGVVAVIRRRFRPLLIGIAVSALALAAVLGPMVVLDRHCTAEQRASLPASQCDTAT